MATANGYPGAFVKMSLSSSTYDSRGGGKVARRYITGHSWRRAQKRVDKEHWVWILAKGVDNQGGTEDIYKRVKVRVELGREWQVEGKVLRRRWRFLFSRCLGVSPGVKILFESTKGLRHM
ncbi:hypothetical protein B0H11DRAFT_1944826 [Mycena galericulata]|nr:hypothetical protein B0H11DRAFT_1944826 [Mycena galericulata]